MSFKSFLENTQLSRAQTTFAHANVYQHNGVQLSFSECCDLNFERNQIYEFTRICRTPIIISNRGDNYHDNYEVGNEV